MVTLIAIIDIIDFKCIERKNYNEYLSVYLKVINKWFNAALIL